MATLYFILDPHSDSTEFSYCDLRMWQTVAQIETVLESAVVGWYSD